MSAAISNVLDDHKEHKEHNELVRSFDAFFDIARCTMKSTVNQAIIENDDDSKLISEHKRSIETRAITNTLKEGDIELPLFEMEIYKRKCQDIPKGITIEYQKKTIANLVKMQSDLKIIALIQDLKKQAEEVAEFQKLLARSPLQWLPENVVDKINHLGQFLSSTIGSLSVHELSYRKKLQIIQSFPEIPAELIKDLTHYTNIFSKTIENYKALLSNLEVLLTENTLRLKKQQLILDEIQCFQQRVPCNLFEIASVEISLATKKLPNALKDKISFERNGAALLLDTFIHQTQQWKFWNDVWLKEQETLTLCKKEYAEHLVPLFASQYPEIYKEFEQCRILLTQHRQKLEMAQNMLEKLKQIFSKETEEEILAPVLHTALYNRIPNASGQALTEIVRQMHEVAQKSPTVKMQARSDALKKFALENVAKIAELSKQENGDAAVFRFNTEWLQKCNEDWIREFGESGGDFLDFDLWFKAFIARFEYLEGLNTKHLSNNVKALETLKTLLTFCLEKNNILLKLQQEKLQYFNIASATRNLLKEHGKTLGSQLEKQQRLQGYIEKISLSQKLLLDQISNKKASEKNEVEKLYDMQWALPIFSLKIEMLRFEQILKALKEQQENSNEPFVLEGVRKQLLIYKIKITTLHEKCKDPSFENRIIALQAPQPYFNSETPHALLGFEQHVIQLKFCGKKLLELQLMTAELLSRNHLRLRPVQTQPELKRQSENLNADFKESSAQRQPGIFLHLDSMKQLKREENDRYLLAREKAFRSAEKIMAQEIQLWISDEMAKIKLIDAQKIEEVKVKQELFNSQRDVLLRGELEKRGRVYLSAFFGNLQSDYLTEEERRKQSLVENHVASKEKWQRELRLRQQKKQKEAQNRTTAKK